MLLNLSAGLLLCVGLGALFGHPWAAAETTGAPADEVVLLRALPTALTNTQVTEMLGRNDFYERQRHPTRASMTTYQKLLFADNANVVVIDHTHNLMWASGLAVKAAAQNASEVVSTLHYAGFVDWRLPTLEELASVLHPKALDFYLDAAFADFRAESSWSADTVLQSESGYGWVVSFTQGVIISAPTTAYHPLLLVRDAGKIGIDSKTGASVRGLSKEW
jgi:hypothetical protein